MLGQLRPIAFAEASHHVELFQRAPVLSLGELEDGVYGLLFGVADETAGVDDCHLAAGVGRVVGHGDVVGAELSHQFFTVDEVF